MFGCVILFLCELAYACVCDLLSVFVCTASCASTTDVGAPKTEVNFRFSMFGCVILLLCERVCVCDVGAPKTEVKLRFSMFDCVILFLCDLVYVCVCVLLSAFVCAGSVRQPRMLERQKLK